MAGPPTVSMKLTIMWQSESFLQTTFMHDDSTATELTVYQYYYVWPLLDLRVLAELYYSED